MPRIDSTEVISLRRELLDVWRDAHAQWRDKAEKLFDGTYPIRAMKPAEPRRLNWGRSKINAFKDTMVTTKPSVKRLPVSEGEQHKKNADKVERWADGVLEKSAVAALAPPFKAAATFLGAYGYTVMSWKWNPRAWPTKPRRGSAPQAFDEYEQKRLVAFPFRIEAPNPVTVLMPPHERTPSMAIETSTIYAWQAEKDFGAKFAGYNGSRFDLLERIDFYTEDMYVVLINNVEVINAKNVWGFVPYTHAYDGSGMQHAPLYSEGTASASGKVNGFGPRPEHMAQGLLVPIRDSIVALDEFFTARHNQTLQNAYRVRLIGGGEDAEEVAQMFEDAGLGGIVPIDKAKIGWEEPPKTDPQDMAIAEMAKRDIDIGTFSTVVQGFQSPNVQTATQHALELGQSRQKFDVPMQQLNNMAAIGLGFCARMLDIRGETCTINGVTVGGDDFENNWEFKVNFESTDEAAKARERAVGMEEVKMGLKSPNTYWDDTGLEDTTEEERRLVVANAKKSPRYTEIVMTLGEQIAQSRLAKRGILLPKPQMVPTPEDIAMQQQGGQPGNQPGMPPPQQNGGLPTPFIQPPGMQANPQQGMVQAGMGTNGQRAYA